ncbi:MAG TPA: sigma-70 family RNA polymerase sigma factor [Chloroflexota bacterium]|nr:sigma-70 family RNA polymerase sigma factor [Chloroflexota bacterium]
MDVGKADSFEARAPFESDLMTAMRQRQEGALEALYDRYAKLTYSLAYRMLGEREAAEDAMQEIFLRAWRSAASYDPQRSSERTWLMSIARNSCIDRLRTSSARPRVDAAAVVEESPGDHDVWGEVSRTLTAERVRGAMGELSAEQRETIRLAYYGGLSQSEIAERMGVPLGTVKGRIRGAVQRLRALLADLETDPMS